MLQTTTSVARRSIARRSSSAAVTPAGPVAAVGAGAVPAAGAGAGGAWQALTTNTPSTPMVMRQSVMVPLVDRPSLDTFHRRRLPSAVGDLRLRHVQAQRQLEDACLRRRQPVTLLVFARRLALDV